MDEILTDQDIPIPPGPEEKTQKKGKGEFVFTKQSLKKKVRFSEILSEKIITGVAFLSITIIVLIFVFVFKETLPIFGIKTAKMQRVPVSEQEQYTGENTNDQKQEVYTGGGDESGAPESVNDNKQEVYTGAGDGSAEPAPVNENKQEVYGGGGGDRPERYGVDEDSAAGTGNSSAGDSSEAVLEQSQPVHQDKVTARGLAGKTWMPVSDNPRYGLIPLIVGTFKITIIAILFAAPLAILAALFSAAFSPHWLREFIKPAIELLAGFPSVVIGFFALMVMATFLQQVFGYSTRLNAFVGGIAMALAAIPVIFTIAEDAMTAVPQSFKEASLALGASKWQTAFFVTLPAATPGIFAAVLLGIGRIFGETMIALMATGNAALISMNPFDSVRTLSATIGAEMAEVVFGDTHYNVLFLIGALLFVFTFSLNALAEFYVKGKLMRRFQGRTA